MISNNTEQKILKFSLTIFSLCIAIYNPEIFGFNLSNFILLGITAVALMRTRIKTSVNKRILFTLIYFYIIILFSAIYSCTKNGFVLFLKLIIPLCFMFICSRVMADNISKKEICNIFALTNICACISGILRLYIFDDYGYTMLYNGTRIARMRGSFLQPNVFATFLIMTMPYSIYTIWFFIKEKNNKLLYRLLLLVDILLNLFCIYMSRSRWSMFVLAIYIFIYIYLLLKNKTSGGKIAGLYISIFICGILYIFLNNNYLISNFFSFRTSNNIRINSYTQAYELIKENHFMGLGLGHGVESVLDSTILNLLIDIGLIGAILYIFLCLFCFIELIKIKKIVGDLITPYMIMFVGFCIEMIAESILYNSLINYFLGIILYLSLSNIYKNENILEILNPNLNLEKRSISL